MSQAFIQLFKNKYENIILLIKSGVVQDSKCGYNKSFDECDVILRKELIDIPHLLIMKLKLLLYASFFTLVKI
jgi:hypothetical protein